MDNSMENASPLSPRGLPLAARGKLFRCLAFPAIPLNVKAMSAIQAIRLRAGAELRSAAKRTADDAARDRLGSIAACLEGCLAVISELANAGHIRPFCRIRLSEVEAEPAIDEQSLRIGFYPLAANPLHWGHILVGLTVMASMSLDKVVFLIAGEDSRKPSMLPAQARHRLGRSVLESFEPLLAYSPLALGTGLDGETNFGRLLDLNSGQRLEAFYVAGADHCRRLTESGRPDTIQKLEWIAEEQRLAGATLHTISVVFMDREGVRPCEERIGTFLRVGVLPSLPLSFSSTAVRDALREETFTEALGSLPYSSFQEIYAARLYTGAAQA